MAKEIGGKVVRIEIGGEPLRSPTQEGDGYTRQTITWEKSTSIWKIEDLQFVSDEQTEPCPECENNEGDEDE